jgi:hypothetical protein
MKTFFQLGAAALVCAFAANAQIIAVLNRFPARSSEVVIRNSSTVNLTAFAVSMASVAQNPADSAPFMIFVDTAVDTDRLAVSHRLNAAMPLAPGQEYAVPITSGLRDGQRKDLFRPPITTAAVFVDGTTAGDPGLLV